MKKWLLCTLLFSANSFADYALVLVRPDYSDLKILTVSETLSGCSTTKQNFDRLYSGTKFFLKCVELGSNTTVVNQP
ncbi:hypothetical protein [Haemophilus paracuniculus]|nr:hypothetical protein [Haemophilus paracuniculus]